jgi:hypothetical protein
MKTWESMVLGAIILGLLIPSYMHASELRLVWNDSELPVDQWLALLFGTCVSVKGAFAGAVIGAACADGKK